MTGNESSGEADGYAEVAPVLDAAVGIGGYRTDLLASVVRPTEAVLDLWAGAGLTHVRIDGSTWEELSILRGLQRQRADAGRALTVGVEGGGPALVDHPPRSEREFWVIDRATLEMAVATSAAQRTDWLDVRLANEQLAAAAIAQGHEAGLRIAFRGSWNLVEQLGPGDHLPVAAEVLRPSAGSPFELLDAWADDASTGAARLATAAGLGLTIGSGLLSLRRAVFVREAVETPFLEELEPILPHSTYIREMRRPGGYFVGKRYLRQHAGMREPSKADLARAEEGWRHLLDAVGAASGSIVPASRSPQLTSVPGYAWVEECAVLRFAGVPNPETRGALLLNGGRVEPTG